jgi:dTDP-glucose 4,6-dehydratase
MSPLMETMLVTGGAGFIGANFVRLALKRTTARILVLDKFTYAGNRVSLDGLDAERIDLVEGDIADPELTKNLILAEKPRWILNFAAESHVDRSIESPDEFLRTNILGTFQLLEASRQLAGTLSSEERARFRFLHVSTDEVYGSLGAEGAFAETTPYAPNSPYAASKASADHLVRAWFHTYGLPTLLTNCSNNYGPYQFPEKLIPLMILNAVEGIDLPVYGDGSNVRDWIYVEDHCDGILTVLQKGTPGEKYNLGGGGERSNLEVVDALCQLLEAHMPAAENIALQNRGLVAYSQLRQFVTDRPGHDRRYAIDGSKAARELGWRPSVGVDQGFRTTVQWYLDNPEWCQQVQEDQYDRARLGLGSRS